MEAVSGDPKPDPKTLGTDAALFWLLAVALAWPTLSWPMVYDDLHLIRAFSSSEIAASFAGSWDPDGVEQPGFRPLSLLFNHARYQAFGENVVAHRLFLLVLLACYLALLVRIAGRFGLSRRFAWLCAAVILCSRQAVHHYVWITSGNRLVQALAFAAAILLLWSGLEKKSHARLFASLAIVGASVMLREDSLLFVPILPLLTLARPSPSAIEASRRALVTFMGLVGLICVSLLAYRRFVLPRAISPGADIAGWTNAFLSSLRPVGPSFDPPSTVFFAAWLAGMVSLSLGLLALRRRLRLRATWVWLACAALAATPSLTIEREDLHFFSTCFGMIAIGLACGELARAAPRTRWAVTALLVLGVAGSAYASRLFAENFHPMSRTALWWNGRFLYGPYAGRATIPEPRLRLVRRQLGGLGIHRWGTLRPKLRELVQEALEENRRRPTGEATLFVPLVPIEGF